MFNGYKVSVWDDEKALELGSGDGSKTLGIYLRTVNDILKNGYNDKVYVMYGLPHIHKETLKA